MCHLSCAICYAPFVVEVLDQQKVGLGCTPWPADHGVRTKPPLPLHIGGFKPYPPLLCAICCVAFGGVDCVVRHCCAPFVVLRRISRLRRSGSDQGAWMISTFPTPSDGRLRNADVEGTTFVDNGVDHTPTRPNAHTPQRPHAPTPPIS